MSQSISDGHMAATSGSEPSAAFTPGPWELDHRREARIIRGFDSGCVAAVPSMATDGHGYCDPAEREANARLIAAAPDLLLALDWLLNIEGQNDRETRYEQRPLALAAARAAIAKALGYAPESPAERQPLVPGAPA